LRKNLKKPEKMEKPEEKKQVVGNHSCLLYHLLNSTDLSVACFQKI